VQINGFCSAKSIVELTCHVLEALESLTLDCIFGAEGIGDSVRRSAGKFSRCKRLNRRMILEAHKALSTVKSYILVRVPSAVKLNVGEPCSRCHSLDAAKVSPHLAIML
jgi:hypothetical protein